MCCSPRVQFSGRENIIKSTDAMDHHQFMQLQYSSSQIYHQKTRLQMPPASVRMFDGLNTISGHQSYMRSAAMMNLPPSFIGDFPGSYPVGPTSSYGMLRHSHPPPPPALGHSYLPSQQHLMDFGFPMMPLPESFYSPRQSECAAIQARYKVQMEALQNSMSVFGHSLQLANGMEGIKTRQKTMNDDYVTQTQETKSAQKNVSFEESSQGTMVTDIIADDNSTLLPALPKLHTPGSRTSVLESPSSPHGNSFTGWRKSLDPPPLHIPVIKSSKLSHPPPLQVMDKCTDGKTIKQAVDLESLNRSKSPVNFDAEGNTENTNKSEICLTTQKMLKQPPPLLIGNVDLAKRLTAEASSGTFLDSSTSSELDKICSSNRRSRLASDSSDLEHEGDAFFSQRLSDNREVKKQLSKDSDKLAKSSFVYSGISQDIVSHEDCHNTVGSGNFKGSFDLLTPLNSSGGWNEDPTLNLTRIHCSAPNFQTTPHLPSCPTDIEAMRRAYLSASSKGTSQMSLLSLESSYRYTGHKSPPPRCIPQTNIKYKNLRKKRKRLHFPPRGMEWSSYVRNIQRLPEEFDDDFSPIDPMRASNASHSTDSRWHSDVSMSKVSSSSDHLHKSRMLPSRTFNVADQNIPIDTEPKCVKIKEEIINGDLSEFTANTTNVICDEFRMQDGDNSVQHKTLMEDFQSDRRDYDLQTMEGQNDVCFISGENCASLPSNFHQQMSCIDSELLNETSSQPQFTWSLGSGEKRHDKHLMLSSSCSKFQAATNEMGKEGEASLREGGSEFRCHLCNYNGRSQHCLNKHFRAHNQACKICRYCLKAFERPSDLVRHEERHQKRNHVLLNTAERPLQPTQFNSGKAVKKRYAWTCRQCNYSCHEARKLILHTRKSHPILFNCNLCGMKFVSDMELVNHKTRYHPLAIGRLDSYMQSVLTATKLVTCQITNEQEVTVDLSDLPELPLDCLGIPEVSTSRDVENIFFKVNVTDSNIVHDAAKMLTEETEVVDPFYPTSLNTLLQSSSNSLTESCLLNTDCNSVMKHTDSVIIDVRPVVATSVRDHSSSTIQEIAYEIPTPQINSNSSDSLSIQQETQENSAEHSQPVSQIIIPTEELTPTAQKQNVSSDLEQPEVVGIQSGQVSDNQKLPDVNPPLISDSLKTVEVGDQVKPINLKDWAIKRTKNKTVRSSKLRLKVEHIVSEEKALIASITPKIETKISDDNTAENSMKIFEECNGLQAENKSKTYVCVRCKYSTQTKFKYQQHLKAHNGRYICKCCNKACIKSSDLYRHWVTHNVKGPDGHFACDSCEFTSPQKYAIEDHMKQHYTLRPEHPNRHLSKMSRCGICQKNVLRSRLFEHKRVVHGKFFVKNHDELANVETDANGNSIKTPSRLFSCPQCDRKFTTPSYLLRHHFLYHQQAVSVDSVGKFEEGICSCRFCGIKVEDVDRLHEHEVNHILQTCSKKNQTEPPKTHIRLAPNTDCSDELSKPTLPIHNTILPPSKLPEKKSPKCRRKLSCPHCQKPFKLQYFLEQHLHIHSGECPYICHMCGDGFAIYQLLNIHRRFKCPNRNIVPKSADNKLNNNAQDT